MKQEQLQAIHDELKEVLERHPLPWKYNFSEKGFAVTGQWIEIEDQEINLGGDASHEFGFFISNAPDYVQSLLAEVRRMRKAMERIEYLDRYYAAKYGGDAFPRDFGRIARETLKGAGETKD